MTRKQFRVAAGELRVVIERLLEQGAPLPRIGGSYANILEHREALWRFVDDPRGEPTNDHAERELRGFVLWRKSTGGSRSEAATPSRPSSSRSSTPAPSSAAPCCPL